MIENFTFHHIGIVTAEINKAARVYEELGYRRTRNSVIVDNTQMVSIIFMKRENHPLIELIQPQRAGSPVENILKKSGPTPYHTCYEVESLKSASIVMKENRFLQITDPTPAIAFNNRKIAFYYSPLIGLIELLEKK